ncbi:MAG: hypothetical protein IK140_03340 [Clostridia bacterium]|nr:hypothetical protein [Clostridia bacterium]MBR5379545.1 hypothetical protein [Clostridia bacterium]
MFKTGYKTRCLVWLLLTLAMVTGCLAVWAEGDTSWPTATIKVQVNATGTLPDPPETYQIQIVADDASYPMPDGAEDGRYILEVVGPTDSSFPAISYDKVGIYTYKISQIAGSDPHAKSYDERVYTLKVTVYRDEATDTLIVAEAFREEGASEKVDGCVFDNEYQILVPKLPGVDVKHEGDCFN